MSIHDEFEAIVASLDGQLAQGPTAARQLLSEVLRRDGQLGRAQAEVIAAVAGTTERTVYRWAKDPSLLIVAAEQPTPGEADAQDVTADLGDLEGLDSLELLKVLGPSAFHFDDTMMALMYLLGGNQKRLRDELVAAGYPVPSLPTICRRWKEVPPLRADGSRFGLANRAKKLLHVRHSAQHSNEVFQFDAFNLDIHVRTPRGRKPIRPNGMLLVDDRSRFIVSSPLIPYPMRQDDVAAAMGAGFDVRAADDGSGVLIGGLCDTLVFDNDAAILAATKVLEGLAVDNKPAPAWTPTAKGKVERTGQTIQSLSVDGQPGQVTPSQRLDQTHLLSINVDELLSFEDFHAIWDDAIYRYNYELPHSALGGRTPFEVYSENLSPRTAPDEVLAKLMLPAGIVAGKRKVHNDGLHVFGRYYVSADLGQHVDSQVSVRGWHDRRDKVSVWIDSSFVAMVPRADHLTADERRLIVQTNIDDRRAVYSHAADARAAMRARSRSIELGAPLGAVDAVLVARGEQPVEPDQPASSEEDATPASTDSDASDQTDQAEARTKDTGSTKDKKRTKASPNPRPAKRRPPSNPKRKQRTTDPVRDRDTAAQKGLDAAAAALDDEDGGK